MKNTKLLLAAFLGLFLTSCEKDPVSEMINSTAAEAPASPTGIIHVPDQYIVVMNDDFGANALKSSTSYPMAQQTMGAEVADLLKMAGISDARVGSVYTEAMKGFTVQIDNPTDLKLLQELRGVHFIEKDQVFSVGQVKEATPTNAKTQVISYGANRVGKANGTGKRAWIVDTGIDLDHPDLLVNTAWSRSFVSGVTSAEDGNGHGTHCAGIVAAKNNTIGTLGVAHGAEVVAIKVLADNGSGYTSNIISGLDYILTRAKAGEVVNMSLGGGISTSLDNAVVKVAGRGIYVAVAAGNSKVSATGSSPARVNATNVYTISAMDSRDTWAYYSNFGNPPVDYCAPGSSIYSTYKGGTYATLSGTSMATPHVAGILLLRGKPLTSGRVINDPDGNADYIAHL